jgi:hypothetical protein
MVHHENVWQSFINEIGEPIAQAHFVALATLAMAMYHNSTASAYNSGALAWPVPSFDTDVIPRRSCTFTIGTEPWCLGKQHMDNGRLAGWLAGARLAAGWLGSHGYLLAKNITRMSAQGYNI